MNNNFLADIVNNLNTVFFLLNQDFEIQQLNQRAQQLFNWTENQALNQDLHKLCEKYKFECPIVKKITETSIKNNDKEIFLRWELKPIESGFVLFGYDITELKQEQEKNFQLDSIIAIMPNNIYWYDKIGTYLGCNENTAKTLGVSRKQAVGKNLYFELLKRLNTPKHIINFWIKEQKEIMAKGTPLTSEEPPFNDINGKTRYDLSTKVPLFNKKGKIYGVLGISKNIVKHKKMEQELIDTKNSNKAKNQFMSVMAQTLKRPILGASGIFRLLTLEPLSDKQHEYLKLAIKHIDNAGVLLQDLLDYSTINPEAKNKNFAQFNLRESINNLYKKHSKNLEKSDVKFSLNYKPKIPTKIWGDKLCIEMLLDNLLGTANDLIDNGNIVLDVSQRENEAMKKPIVVLTIKMDKVKKDLAYNQELFVSQLNGAEFIFHTTESNEL